MTHQAQLLLQSMRTGAAILSAEGRITYCNDALAELLGVRRQRGRHVRIAECLVEADRPAFAELLSGAARGRVEAEFRIAQREKGGVPVRIWLSPAAAPQGGFYLEATVVNEEALRARFRAVFERAPLGMTVIAPDGRLIQVNRAYCEFTGYEERELLARDFQSITHADDLEQNLRLHRLTLEGKLPHYEMQKRYVRKDGTIVWGRLQVAAIVDGWGKTSHLVGLVEDVSERRRAEETLQAMTDSLQRLSRRLLYLQDEERRRLARELHDGMGQSLSALKLNIERLQLSGTITERLRPVAEESVQLAGQLCREVRSLSYLLHPPLLDELGLESALLAYARGVSERTGIEIDVDLPRGFGRLEPEVETAVFRIVQEGLSNVHRHSGSARAAVKLERGADGIRLELRDWGRGLAQGPQPSYGVGLAGIRERTSQLGGSFELEAARPGMKLKVVLPLEP